MTPFAINLVLAVVWAALNDSLSVSGMLTGFLVGYLVMWMLQPLFGPSRYSRKLAATVQLGLFFIYELLVSSIRVAWDVLTPVQSSKPGIIGVPLSATTDAEITVLANLVSLTPGSLSIDVSEDRKTLLVHAMFIDDPDALTREIKDGMERRVLEVLR